MSLLEDLKNEIDSLVIVESKLISIAKGVGKNKKILKVRANVTIRKNALLIPQKAIISVENETTEIIQPAESKTIDNCGYEFSCEFDLQAKKDFKFGIYLLKVKASIYWDLIASDNSYSILEIKG